MPLQKPRRWLGYEIHLNDLIADSEAILDRFESSDIPLDDCFGSSSDPAEAPRSTILYFGPGTEPARLAELLRFLDGFSIHHLQAGTDPQNRKVIFIGSYNFDVEPAAPLSAELLTSIRAAAKAEDVTEVVLAASSITPLTVRS